MLTGPGGGQGGRTDDFSENEVSDGVSTSGCSGVVPGNAALAGCACSSAAVVVERAWRFPFKLIATLERVRERRLDLEWSKGSSLDPGSMRIRANSLNDALLFKVDWLKGGQRISRPHIQHFAWDEPHQHSICFHAHGPRQSVFSQDPRSQTRAPPV